MPVCRSQKAAMLKSGFSLAFEALQEQQSPDHGPFILHFDREELLHHIRAARGVLTQKQLEDFIPSLEHWPGSRDLAVVSSSNT